MSSPVTNIVILLDLPLDQRLFNFLGIETLMRNGFDVEIWDLTPFFHREFQERIVIDGRVEFNRYRKFHTKRKIVRAISDLSSGTMVNSFISFQCQTYFIYRLLSAKKIRYCVTQMISFPALPAPQKWNLAELLKSLFKRVTALKPKHVFLGLCDKILLKYYFMFGIRPADVALMSGEKSLEILRDPIDEKTHKIWAHSWDYDVYLEERNNPVSPDPAVGVFLDEYFPLHTDLDYLGISSPVGVDEYFEKLCSFFDHVEKNYHVRIVIAAHPRSNYPESTKYFGGRSVIKGQTAHMVHKSSFVIAHDSTSINFAVLFRKPILFITMDKIQKCDAGRLTTALSIEAMAQSLRKKPINIDTMAEFNWVQELEIDTKAYEHYQNDIIKKVGTPDIPFWEIYTRSIRQIYP